MANGSTSQLWSVEAWRGLAAALVVWAHWAAPLGFTPYWSAYAFVGVDVFFVISGAVFAPTLMNGVSALPAYALRRFMRIYPAYLASLAAYAAWAAWQGRPLLYLPEHLLMAHLQSREMTFYYNPPYWSLPAEVEFYALVPLLALALRHTGGAGVAGMLLVAGLLRLWLAWAADGQQQNAAYIWLHHLPGMGVEFGLGTAAWYLAQRMPSAGMRAAAVMAGLVGCAATVVLYRWLEDTGPSWRNGQLGALTAACFALVLAGTMGMRPRQTFWIWTGLWAGRLSYGVYLLHMAWLPLGTALLPHGGRWVALLAATAATLASAWLLHVTVEEPARRWARRISQRWQPAQKTSVSPG